MSTTTPKKKEEEEIKLQTETTSKKMSRQKENKQNKEVCMHTITETHAHVLQMNQKLSVWSSLFGECG